MLLDYASLLWLWF